MTLVIILSVYCYSELTTDSFHKNGDRVFLYGSPGSRVYTPGILKDEVDQKIPGVESIVRIAESWEAPVFQSDNKDPITSDLIFADECFFNLFTYKTVDGNTESAMKEPFTVVITNVLADKLFGKETAVGKRIKLNNSRELTVQAVIEVPKENSCLSFSAVTSIATRKVVENQPEEYKEWGWSDFQTFFLLKKGTNPEIIEKSIFSFIPEKNQKEFNASKLNPFKTIYFSKFSLFDRGYIRNSDKTQVIILVIVAILILLIALVNFINISISQWMEQIRQTGVMKVLGATKQMVIRNILIESFVLFLIALIIAIDLVPTLIPFIRNYTGIQFDKAITYSTGFIFISIASIVILSLVFSIVPAIRISSSRAVDNLKKSLKVNTNIITSRSLLVIAQFTIAIVLISFTLLVRKQVNFGCSNLGVNQENIVGIKLTQELNEKKDILKKMLLEKPAITGVSFSQFFPGKTVSQWWGIDITINGEKKKVNFDTFSADASFMEMMGLQLKSGRFYTDSLQTDKGKMVVNETFLRENNISDPLGAKFGKFKGVEAEIVGVVKDFRFKPISKPVTALAIRNDDYASYGFVKLKTSDFKSLLVNLKEIRKIASELSPSFPVELNFFDQAIENMYASELRFHRIFTLFAACAIVICCLGILAISIFACQRRIKEIGIRKVNGARVSEILLLINIDLVKWLAISFIIASFVAYYFMNKWLESFAYKTEISWWIFALAVLIALGIALLTVSWQSWRAATRNPVEALRYE